MVQRPAREIVSCQGRRVSEVRRYRGFFEIIMGGAHIFRTQKVWGESSREPSCQAFFEAIKEIVGQRPATNRLFTLFHLPEAPRSA